MISLKPRNPGDVPLMRVFSCIGADSTKLAQA